MTLILNGQPPLHWFPTGLFIAAITLLLLYLGNRRLGISTGFEDVCAMVLRVPYYTRDGVRSGRDWRLPFLGGLFLGGMTSAVLSGGWRVTWNAGMLDSALALGPAAKVAWMFVAGLFIGFGTRLAGGCTSGHGIFGMANLERPSIVATLSFMMGGIVTTQVLYRVIVPLVSGP